MRFGAMMGLIYRQENPMGAQSKPSKEEAENFHVLPKDKTVTEQSKKPENTEPTGHVIDRDADAGSLLGTSNTGDPQRLPTDDRSQVS